MCASLVFWGFAGWTGTARAQAGTVTPPSVVSHVDAIYPPSALAERKHVDVVLTVTVDADGHVSKVDVFQTGGDDLDEAAIVAVRQWTFVPAMRDGKALPSRIRVPFHFAPPAAPPELVAPPAPAPGAIPELPSKNAVPAAPEPAPATSSAAPSAAEAPPPPSEVTVRGSVTPQTHGASDIHIDVGALAAVPRQNA
ncbi:MAG TPA: energy transducer TonB, partial [Polyangiaceae bacterium]|nr:energy transducer TonB [Polyangiaceae bacterium]